MKTAVNFHWYHFAICTQQRNNFFCQLEENFVDKGGFEIENIAIHNGIWWDLQHAVDRWWIGWIVVSKHTHFTFHFITQLLVNKMFNWRGAERLFYQPLSSNESNYSSRFTSEQKRNQNIIINLTSAWSYSASVKFPLFLFLKISKK